MKVILLHELKGRGGEGDVIDVAQGFAVNYLLPRKIAIQATPGNVKQLEHRMHNIKKREDLRIGDASSLAAALADKTVTIAAKAGEEGRLFGSVTTMMIEEAIREQLGIELDRRKIETHGHIKEVGPHLVNIAIYRDVKSQLTVKVVAEGAPVAPTAPTTVVAEVEGVTAEGEPFVEVVEETVEQSETDVALEEAADEAAAE
ncbi:MAG: 50S ribosomal protein L9 [Actinobacteria bacterium HGW-Actinobacteria-7]|jgi:large subunit ribosomal protein L9|nr:MAG: 50S ribosomal protein L9 [Actinobacteria bacterium HGW-Actinobacteria-7]